MNQFLKRYSTIFKVITVSWLTCCAFSMIFEPTWFMQIPLLVLSTTMLVMNLTYSAVSKVFKEEAASQLEQMQLTLKITEKLCENADYEQMDKLKELLNIRSQSEDAEQSRTTCCGYADVGAIRFNPCNNVMQCHNCGHVYVKAKGET